MPCQAACGDLVTRADTAFEDSKQISEGGHMESIIVACITGVVTLVGVILSNSKSRAVMELKIDNLAVKVSAHNHLIERTYQLEQDMAVAQNDIVTLYHRTEEDK